MKYGFLTSYEVNNNPYGSYVVAKDEEQAKSMTKSRGLGEKIVSKRMPIPDPILTKQQVDMQNLQEMLHSVCFLTFIASKAKIVGMEEIVGDEGILHEMIHEMNSGNNKKISALKKRIKTLIQSVPGVI